MRTHFSKKCKRIRTKCQGFPKYNSKMVKFKTSSCKNVANKTHSFILNDHTPSKQAILEQKKHSKDLRPEEIFGFMEGKLDFSQIYQFLKMAGGILTRFCPEIYPQQFHRSPPQVSQCKQMALKKNIWREDTLGPKNGHFQGIFAWIGQCWNPNPPPPCACRHT